jgi:ATP phosphoribosyltransferase regulatory subunit
MPTWLLPENIADVLPSEARKIEELRRLMLDTFRTYGYELVMPPMLEYVESLLAGAGQDTDSKTFKLVDSMSGRLLGLRADMTTQVARIDAHLLNRDSVTRLCYAGTCCTPARPACTPPASSCRSAPRSTATPASKPTPRSRNWRWPRWRWPASTSRAWTCPTPACCARSWRRRAAKRDEQLLHGLLRSKDMPGLDEATRDYAPATRAALMALPNLYGDVDVLACAKELLPALPGITRALAELAALAGIGHRPRQGRDRPGRPARLPVRKRRHVRAVRAGPAERGGRGGRYDHVGEAFGRARPATGFSLDLRELARLLPTPSASTPFVRRGAMRPNCAKKSLNCAKQAKS